jgi:hypothetical protein
MNTSYRAGRAVASAFRKGIRERYHARCKIEPDRQRIQTGSPWIQHDRGRILADRHEIQPDRGRIQAADARSYPAEIGS